MPIKIDIQTNIKDGELTIESCSQIITMLQDTYKNLRGEIYNHFLGMKQLKKAVIIATIPAVLYIVLHDIFFLYLTPVSILLSMMTGVISAEFITSQTRKQISHQITHFKDVRDRLIRNQKFNA
ncbi:MAG: hypothetical protein K2P09_08230 [Erysipelotrichales bacterium]|nr:hypothetical protein [Erysipelotrichales bacterium]